MDAAATQIREMVPSVIPTRSGWLALSPRLAPINIGVVGSTEDEARTRFSESADAWARLHDAPEPELRADTQ